MRDPRYSFSDDVRVSTRAIALRMIHAGAVASSPEELDAWISRAEDLRERLTKGGYGSAFGADDLFPLFQSCVAKASAVAPSRRAPRLPLWLWIAAVVVGVAIIVAVVIAARLGF